MPDRIGPFEVLRELGRGGMGVVYLARDTRLGRDVAIKALPQHLAADPNRLERFEREARTLAGLNHPHIAGIHGIEEQEGARYLVLEYVEGETLADRLDRGSLSPDEAVEFAIQIAAGVEAAHDAGVIHRDLKPGNIVVTPDGVAKVLDFGLARTEESTSSTSSPDSPTITTPAPQHSPTAEGLILGTAAYMSPEQARGRRVDKRTDIWSFGVVLYEMLAGASPFVGETVSDSIGAVLHKSFEFDRLPPQTSANTRRVLERCLQRDKQLRYRDIGDVRIELQSAPAQRQQDMTGPGSSRSLALIAGWAAAVMLAAAAAFAFFRPAPTSQPIHAAILAPDGIRIRQVAISPDGATLIIIGQVFDAERGDASFRHVAYLRHLASDDLQQLEDVPDPWSAAFSPDGRWIAVLANSDSGSPSDIYRVPANLSGPPVKLCSIDNSAAVFGRNWFAWTPANEIAFLDSPVMELVVVSAGTGNEIRRVPIQGEGLDQRFGSFVGPFGDRWVSLVDPIFSDAGFREDCLLIDVQTGLTARAILGAANARLARDGRVLFSRGSQVLASDFDMTRLELSGEITPVHSDLSTATSWANGTFSLAETGVLAYMPGGVRGKGRSIVELDMQFNESPWSDELGTFELDIAASPDAKRLAVVASSPTGMYQVLVADTERRRFRRLLGDPGHDFSDPIFTPDGEKVIATRGSTGPDSTTQIVIIPFDARGDSNVVFESEPGENIDIGCVSHDGQWVLGTKMSRAGEKSFLEIPLDDSKEPRELEGLHDSTSFLRYAPNGVPLIAYISSESGQPLLYVRDFENGKLGAEVPVTDIEVVAAGWADFDETSVSLSYLGADRSVYMQAVRLENKVTIEERRFVRRDDQGLLDVAAVPGVGAFAIKRGDDEGPITRVDVVTNWLDATGK